MVYWSNAKKTLSLWSVPKWVAPELKNHYFLQPQKCHHFPGGAGLFMQSSDGKNERYIKTKKFYCYFLNKHHHFKIKPKTCHSPCGSPDLFSVSSEQLLVFLCNTGLHDYSHVLGLKTGINSHPKEKQIPLNHVQRQQNLHPYLGHPLQEFSFLTIKIMSCILNCPLASQILLFPCAPPCWIPESFCTSLQEFSLNWALPHFSFVTPFCISE